MTQAISKHVHKIGKYRKLETLVENRMVFNTEMAELNIYETLQSAQLVELQFASPVLASMIEGKKIMHLQGQAAFDFMPGESLMMPAREAMLIDFPEARTDKPTKCLALTISPELIGETINLLNEQAPRLDSRDNWQLDDHNYHFMNDAGIWSTLSRLVYLLTENNIAKKIFAANAIRELVIRLMQTQVRQLLVNNYRVYANTHRLAYAVEYIKTHLPEQISVDKLCEKACMSKAQFFRSFKQEFGITPIDFVMQERMKIAKEILADPLKTVSDAGYEAGFNSTNYFIRAFRNLEGITPHQYKKSLLTRLSS